MSPMCGGGWTCMLKTVEDIKKLVFWPLFFENLFNKPADSRFPKIQIKIKKLIPGFFIGTNPKFESAFYFV